jgi:hypothetical protein
MDRRVFRRDIETRVDLKKTMRRATARRTSLSCRLSDVFVSRNGVA